MSNEIKDITVLYNSVSLFNDIAPDPFISFQQDFLDYKNITNQVTRLTFEGQLTGKYVGQKSFTYLNESLDKLLSRLSINFKSLRILQNQGKPSQEELFFNNCAIVDSINISEDRWYNLLPFSIDFIIYETGLFNDYFNVIDPVQTIDFKDGDGERTSLTYQVNAKGLRTNSKSALENAKSWVISKTGDLNNVLPFYSILRLNSYPNVPGDFLLKSSNENIDRINGFYGVELNFERSTSIEDKNDNCLTNYSIDISSGIRDNQGFITAKIQGSLENIKEGMMQTEAADLTSKAYTWSSFAISQAVPGTALSFDPINYNITEYKNQNKIEFDFEYDNDFFPGNIIKNYDISFQTDLLTNITTASINANISAKRGPLRKRWEEVEEAFEAENFYSVVLTAYYKEGFKKMLFQEPESESITKNEFDGTISYQASWTDKIKKYPNEFLNFESSVTHEPSRTLYAKATSAYVTDEHNVQNLNTASRARLNITVQGTLRNKNPNPNDINTAKGFLAGESVRISTNFLAKFGATKAFREKSSFNYISGVNPVNISLNEEWTFNGSIY